MYDILFVATQNFVVAFRHSMLRAYWFVTDDKNYFPFWPTMPFDAQRVKILYDLA